MILVLGGTTEGKSVMNMLEEYRLPYIYSTKTKVEFYEVQAGTQRHGALAEHDLEYLIEEEDVRVIINAAHPFAEELHQMVSTVSLAMKVPVIRVSRSFPLRRQHPLIHYVSNYDEAIKVLAGYNNPILLALTGVQSIIPLTSYWVNHITYFRVLPRKTSVQLAADADFPLDQLIQEHMFETVEEEYNLIKGKAVEVVLTKESGLTGKLDVKIEAALRAGVPIIIIKRPTLPMSDFIAETPDEVYAKLNELLSL